MKSVFTITTLFVERSSAMRSKIPAMQILCAAFASLALRYTPTYRTAEQGPRAF
jgi:hypothetical protein